MPDKDLAVKQAIEGVLNGCRKGRKKVIRMVQRRNPEMTISKIRRIYVQSGLSLYQANRKRKIFGKGKPLVIPMAKNEEWALDFMHDQLVNGRNFRTMNLVDEYDRRCLVITSDTSITARRVTRELERVIECYGKPKAIRTDNGPEFISKWFQNWLGSKGIKWSSIEKGKPSQNAIIERFNRTYREDVLDANLFFTLEEVRKKTETFLNEYNTIRPHEALKYSTPWNFRG